MSSIHEPVTAAGPIAGEEFAREVLRKGRRNAVLQALLVTFLWSTSWILIKIGIDQIPALTFAGLRYTLAAACLLPFALHGSRRTALRSLTRRDWLGLALLGVILIAVAQGGQFLGLAALPAVTVSMVLNFTSLVVALLGMAFLGERPTMLQWAGMLLFLAGVLTYFLPVQFPAGQWLALGALVICVAGNAVGSVLGRGINRSSRIPPLLVTTISMAVGSVVLLAAGIVTQGLPALGPREWLIIAWLAVVNTAFAFTLWNNTLRTLTAVESSIINGTMLIQIAVMAWIFLGEGLTIKTGLGMLAAGAGALLVQLRPGGMKRG